MPHLRGDFPVITNILSDAGTELLACVGNFLVGRCDMAGRFIQLDDPFLTVKREMDQLLSTFLQPQAGSRRYSRGGREQAPAINMWESEDALFIELEVPGFTMDQLELSIEGKELSLKASPIPAGQDDMTTTWHRRERGVNGFARTIALPIEIRADRAEANVRDGVLTVQLPKSEAAKPTRIKVNG